MLFYDGFNNNSVDKKRYKTTTLMILNFSNSTQRIILFD